MHYNFALSLSEKPAIDMSSSVTLLPASNNLEIDDDQVSIGDYPLGTASDLTDRDHPLRRIARTFLRYIKDDASKEFRITLFDLSQVDRIVAGLKAECITKHEGDPHPPVSYFIAEKIIEDLMAHKENLQRELHQASPEN